MRKSILSLSLLLLTGCKTLGDNQAMITFGSNPPGATISYPGGAWGVAPVTRVWTLAKERKTAKAGPFTATWVSGAQSTITINLQAGHAGFYTFVRPKEVAGLETDVQWAIHLQQEKSAKAARRDAAWKDFNDSLKEMQPAPAPAPRRESVTTDCTTRGNRTTCTSR